MESEVKLTIPARIGPFIGEFLAKSRPELIFVGFKNGSIGSVGGIIGSESGGIGAAGLVRG